MEVSCKVSYGHTFLTFWPYHILNLVNTKYAPTASSLSSLSDMVTFLVSTILHTRTSSNSDFGDKKTFKLRNQSLLQYSNKKTENGHVNHIQKFHCNNGTSLQ